MLSIFKKDPPLSYIFTPYKPTVNSTAKNENIINQRIDQENLNEVIRKDMMVDTNEKQTK